ncbi:winged helix-turn-helix domain-containing protein [Lelliottia amnigena]|uniref:winged helix-turn-helix domain-containing protein n=1 Tax=Lelliottia amnigena TaxID=61646 RepID=UPI004055D055
MTTSDDAMKKVFLINDTLLFEPDLRRLGPLEGYPNRAITLHGPVNECLLLLLEHNDQVLTQRFLFASVWEKQGAIVSTNALYQTIASIRKALKSSGLDENIIKTIPKEGFKSVALVRTGERDEFVPSQKASPEAALTDLSSEMTIPDNVARVAPQKRSFFASPLAYAVAGLMFILSCSVLVMTLKGNETAFENYQHVGKINDCDVYSSWREKEKSIGMFNQLSKRYPINCNTGGMVWMTLNHAQRGSSVMICDRNPQDTQAQCNSIFYRKQNDDEE